MAINVLNTDAGLSGTTLLNAESSQTITGAKNFDRDPNPPFTVASGSAKVDNLDSDKWDGQELPADPGGDRIMFWDESANAVAWLTPSADFTISGTDLSLTADNTVVTILDRDTSQQNVVSSTSETTVYSFSVPGGTLSTNRVLRLTLLGDYLNNSGGVAAITVRVKYGSTTVLSATHGSFAANADRRYYRLTVNLCSFNSATAQLAHGVSSVGAVTTTAGAMAAAAELKEGIHTSVAENSAGVLTLSFTVQHDTSSANISFRANIAQLELL